MGDIIWSGRPNAIPFMHPIGMLTRLLPSSVGIAVAIWIVNGVWKMQLDHSSVESIIVDGMMSIMLLPMVAPCVFVFLEPLRRKLFWRSLTYEIAGTSLRIVMRMGNYKKVFTKSFDEIGVAAIRRSSGGYTIDFGELPRWYSFVGKNGGLCEEFEFSCLSSETMLRVVEICLSRGVKIEAYKQLFGAAIHIAKADDFVKLNEM